jgi:hypothetical protein
MKCEAEAGRFPITAWSEVVRAGQPDTEAGQKALGALLAKYRLPLTTHLRWRLRLSEAEAEPRSGRSHDSGAGGKAAGGVIALGGPGSRQGFRTRGGF